jgi:dimethylargininase
MARILVRRPSPALADAELTHLDRVAIDADLALRQWEAYVAAFEANGWDVEHLPAADDQPDGVFVEDTMVVFGDDLVVLARAGAESRRGEAETAAAAAATLGLPVEAIAAPATLEGGDVLKIGDTVYVGLSTRTDEAAHHQLRALLAPTGRTVVSVPMDRALHLKTAVTALPDGTVIGWEPWLDDPSVFPEFLAVPEREGTAVVVLDPTTVLISASAPATADLLRARGLTVVTTPVTEFEKAEGCVTCLSVRIRS